MSIEAINEIVKDNLQGFVEKASDAVAEDVKVIIGHGEQFPAPESEVPSPLGPVTPYPEFSHPKFGTVTRADIKRKLGRSAPNTPRFSTGLLMRSIHAEYGDLTGKVDASAAPYADEQQEGAPAGWVDEYGYTGGTVPARPFMGVSTRAYQKIEQILKKTEAELQRDLDRVELRMRVSA